jgi:group I intron endonuclease
MPKRPQIELSREDKNAYLCRTDSQRWPLGEKVSEHPAVLFLFRKFNSSEMSEKIRGIYKITSITHPNKIYIGSSSNFEKRQQDHLRFLRNKKHFNRKIQNHVNKYGIEDLIFSVIENCEENILFEREQYYIDTLKPWFNLSPTARGARGVKHSAEVRRRNSERNTGEKHPMFGKRQSKETCEKKSKAMKGKPLSPEHNKKNSESHIGQKPWNKDIPWSQSVKDKISVAKRGIKLSPLTAEHKRKIGDAQRGEKNHRFGKPSTMKGRHHSAESNKKNSESHKKIWAEKKSKGYIPPKRKRKYSDEEIKERKKIQKRRYRLRDKIMAKLHINELTVENLFNAEIPVNHVLIETEVNWHDKKTKKGIVVGFNEDVLYAEGEGSHVADLTIPYGVVKKIPKILYFNPTDPKSMDWETEIEIFPNDVVWFGILESRNAVCVLCESKLYRIIPYQDLYVARHGGFNGEAIPLNGYVLLEPRFCPVLSDLDHFSGETIDTTRGVIKFIGTPPKGYIRDNYSHILDLRVGDEVLFDKKTPLFMLERSRALCCFSGDEQFWVVARRRIALILKRNEKN